MKQSRQLTSAANELATGSCPLCRGKLPTIITLLCTRNRLLNNAGTEEERDEICSIAVEELESVLDTNPGFPAAHQRLGETYTIMMEKDGQAINSHVAAYCASENMHKMESVHNTSFVAMARVTETKPTNESIDFDAICQSPGTQADPIFCCNILSLLCRAYLRSGNVQSARKALSVADHLIQQHPRIVHDKLYNACPRVCCRESGKLLLLGSI